MAYNQKKAYDPKNQSPVDALAEVAMWQLALNWAIPMLLWHGFVAYFIFWHLMETSMVFFVIVATITCTLAAIVSVAAIYSIFTSPNYWWKSLSSSQKKLQMAAVLIFVLFFIVISAALFWLN